MAQLSSVTAAIKDKNSIFIPGQFALELVKLAVGDTDGRGNMTFVVFWTFRPGINEYHFVGIHLFCHVLYRDACIITRNFHPGRETVRKDLDVFVSKFFRLPGGFVTKFSCRTFAIKNQHRVFIFRQLGNHFVKLTVGNINGCRNIPFNIFWLIRP